MNATELTRKLAGHGLSTLSAAATQGVNSGARSEAGAALGQGPLLGSASGLPAPTADSHSHLMNVVAMWVDKSPALASGSGVGTLGRMMPNLSQGGDQAQPGRHFGSPWQGLLDGIAPPNAENKNQSAGKPKQTAAPHDPLQVAQGQLTFDAEGTEGGRYHSRRIHWPGGASGVTIGRGYDLSKKNAATVRRDLTSAGIGSELVEKLERAAGLIGQNARDFCQQNASSLPEITLEQQEKLFQISYAWHLGDARRIADSKSAVAQYGKVDWDKLNPVIADLVVDLRYRGDYTPATRKNVQPLIATNDLAGLLGVMSNQSLWASVPKDRFNRRVEYLRSALQGKASAPLQSAGGTAAHEPSTGAGTKKKTKSAASTPTRQATVSVAALNVREQPSLQGRRLGKLTQGTTLTVVGPPGEWLKIEYKGETGFVYASYTSLGGTTPHALARQPEASDATQLPSQNTEASSARATQPHPPLGEDGQQQIGPLIPVSGWISQYSDADAGRRLTRQERIVNGQVLADSSCCNRACVAMLKDAGVAASGPGQSIQTLKEEHGKNQVTGAAQKGFNYLDRALSSGQAVMVGVDHHLGKHRNDGTTDHFVVVVGSGVDASGRKFYRFYDPGTRFHSSGTSERNRLYLDADDRATGQRSGGGALYTMSQVRPNQARG